MVDPERVHDRLDRLEVEVTRLRQLAEQDTQRLVDEHRVAEILRTRLGDFEGFRAAIARRVADG